MSGSGGGSRRPWHGAANPMDALHDWMLGELAAIRRELASVQAPRSDRDDIKFSSSPPPSALGLSGPPNMGTVAASSPLISAPVSSPAATPSGSKGE